MSIHKNLEQIQKRIRSITHRKVTILAATKTRTSNQIKEVILAGITNIGESRLQEALKKIDEIPYGIVKHFIGRLQSNKVSSVVEHFDVIQSVDSIKLAQTIDKAAKAINKIMPILIQVNTSGESQKGGVDPEGLANLLKKTSLLTHIKIHGLMTIAIRSQDESNIHACFSKLRKLRDSLIQSYPALKTLSMGMSNDYEIAVEEGATMIRIGRAL